MRATRLTRALLLAIAIAALAPAGSALAAGSASISGVVKDADGNPITTGDICLNASASPPMNAEGDFLAFGRSTADGSYTLTGLRADTWSVIASDCTDSARNDAQTRYPLGAVTVTAGQAISGIDIALKRGATVSGHVYLGPGTDTPIAGVCAQTWDAGFGAPRADTDADGAYTITRLDPDKDYTLSFGPDSCNAISWPRPYNVAYYGGTSSATATLLPLSADQPLTGIDGHLTASNASISGVVKDADGDPITSGDVCVQALATDSYAQATTGSNGGYSLTGLTAGTYTVAFGDCSTSARNDVPAQIEVVVGASEAVTAPDVTLGAGTSISGRVYGGAGTGTPLAGQCITLWSSVTQSSSNGATTAADGSYVIRHIDPAKSYRLSSGCSGLLPVGNLLDFAGEFYGGTSWDTATALSPTLAQPLTGIDFHERPVFEITGGPADGSTTDATSATFMFAGFDGWTLECAVDGAALSACPATFTTGNLSTGQHKLDVRATSGPVHTSTKTVRWTITGTPAVPDVPATTTTTAPTATTTNSSSLVAPITSVVPATHAAAKPRPLAPAPKLLSPSKLSLATALKSGVRLKLACTTACTATVRLKHGSTLLGTTKGALTAKGRTLTVHLSSKARASLKRQRRAFKVTAAITVTSPGRTSRVVTRSLTIVP